MANGKLYFNAFEPIAGQEPRFFNGTSVSLVSDIRAGATGSGGFSYFAAIGTDIYFQASDGVTGAELWKWDGVTATLAADITPGSGGSLEQRKSSSKMTSSDQHQPTLQARGGQDRSVRLWNHHGGDNAAGGAGDLAGVLAA